MKQDLTRTRLLPLRFKYARRLMSELDLGLLGLEPGKLIWGQLGKAWWPGRVSCGCALLCALGCPVSEFPMHARLRHRVAPRYLLPVDAAAASLSTFRRPWQTMLTDIPFWLCLGFVEAGSSRHGCRASKVPLQHWNERTERTDAEQKRSAAGCLVGGGVLDSGTDGHWLLTLSEVETWRPQSHFCHVNPDAQWSRSFHAML
jgi:hypothetical protein